MKVIYDISVEGKMVTPSAKAAFSALNALRPKWRWEAAPFGDVCVGIAAVVQDCDSDEPHPVAVPEGRGKTFNDAVVDQFQSLQRAVSGRDVRIVVETEGGSRAGFKYDRLTKTFGPSSL